MKIREILTLVLGLAVVAGVLLAVKLKEPASARSSAASTGTASAHAGTTPRNGPKKTARVLCEGRDNPSVSILIDEGMPTTGAGLLGDTGFHAYADVSMDSEQIQWIPISVDHYDADAGIVGIRSTAGETTVPKRGMFLLTRVPR